MYVYMLHAHNNTPYQTSLFIKTIFCSIVYAKRQFLKLKQNFSNVSNSRAELFQLIFYLIGTVIINSFI